MKTAGEMIMNGTETWERLFIGAGSAVDFLFLAPPRMAHPFRRMGKITRNEYKGEVDLYIDGEYAAKNPLVMERYHSHAANRHGCLVR